jgi:hypothetical protein
VMADESLDDVCLVPDRADADDSHGGDAIPRRAVLTGD